MNALPCVHLHTLNTEQEERNKPYLFLWQNILDTSEGHFHRILKLFLTNSNEKKIIGY